MRDGMACEGGNRGGLYHEVSGAAGGRGGERGLLRGGMGIGYAIRMTWSVFPGSIFFFHFHTRWHVQQCLASSATSHAEQH